jgi:hypothetical protein
MGWEIWGEGQWVEDKGRVRGGKRGKRQEVGDKG